MSAVPRRVKWGAVVIVVAAAFVYAAGLIGEGEAGAGPLWYWKAIQFGAVWTMSQTAPLIIGIREYSVRMFSGRTFRTMILAATLLFASPFVFALTQNLPLALACFVASVLLWLAAASMWTLPMLQRWSKGRTGVRRQDC